MPSNKGKSGTIARMECQLIRDFSTSVDALLEQFSRFKRSGTLSHPTLRELIGVFENRGSLWRLKDVGHLLFSTPENPAGQLLDRTLGAIYHETVKLMEATYQSQHYASVCKTFLERNSSSAGNVDSDGPGSPAEEAVTARSAGRLLAVLQECTDDLGRGIERLEELLEIARPLLCICFAGKGSNQMLTKYLAGRQELIKRVMSGSYEDFTGALGGRRDISPAD